MKNILKYWVAFVTAALIAGFVFISCNQILSPPSSSAKGATTTGKTLVRIASSSYNTRTLMPVMINETDVSKYEVSITKEGLEGEFWTAESDADKKELEEGGHGFDLGDGTWTVTINAYRIFDGTEYLAGSGAANFTVKAAASNTVSVTITEIAKPGWNNLKGIFTWNLTLPDGVTIVAATLDGAGLNGESGSINKNAGIYQYSLILKETATGLTAGTYERVYIYPGLETPAVFNFANGDYKLVFGENIPVSGTLAAVTGTTVSPEGTDFTITAYSDAACTQIISIAPAPVDSGWNWTAWIPAKPSQTVYFRALSLKWNLDPTGGVSNAVVLTAEVKNGVLVPAPVITKLGGTVSISGEPFIGNTLTAGTGGLTGQGGPLSYQWKAGGSNVGTDSPRYTIAGADLGQTITVTVTSPGNDGSVTSSATAAVTLCTVTFNGNGNTGGSVPAQVMASYGSSITLPGAGTGSAALTRPNYTFNGCNTQANGTGTQYAEGA